MVEAYALFIIKPSERLFMQQALKGSHIFLAYIIYVKDNTVAASPDGKLARNVTVRDVLPGLARSGFCTLFSVFVIVVFPPYSYLR